MNISDEFALFTASGTPGNNELKDYRVVVNIFFIRRDRLLLLIVVDPFSDMRMR